jgi:flavorubredoxin
VQRHRGHGVGERLRRRSAHRHARWRGARARRHTVVWQSAPHLPHGWECGFLYDKTTRLLFSGDLFTQPGIGERPIVEDDILAPSEAFRRQMDYYAHAPDTGKLIDKLAALEPAYLACMHGSAWRGNGGALLRDLGKSLAV